MAVPNYAHVPSALYATGLYNLKTHDGSEAFVDAVIATLNGLDSNFRHLKKKPGQTDVHGHGEDSFVYLLPDNKAQAGDFIQGAGGPDPKPRWGIDPEPFYTHADAHDPDDHGIGDGAGTPPPVPVYPPYPGDPVFDALGDQLFADYATAQHAPNGGMGRWFGRTEYDWLATVVPTLQASIDKHKIEWREALNAWRASVGKPPIVVWPDV